MGCSNLDIINFYNYRRANIKDRAARKLDSLDELLGRLRENYYWFAELSRVDLGYEGTINHNLTKEERDQYRHAELGEVMYLILYRDMIIPVYDDGPGQQDVALINGEIVSGGAYNFAADEYFMFWVDNEEYFKDQKEVESYYQGEKPMNNTRSYNPSHDSYYACIKYKDGRVERVRFEDRKEARKYIADNWDEEESVQAWTE